MSDEKQPQQPASQQQKPAPQQQPEQDPQPLTSAEKEAELQDLLKEIDQTIASLEGSKNAKVQAGLAKLRALKNDLTGEWLVAKRWGAVAQKVLQTYSLIKFIYDIFMS
jgi:hypothetical protein